MTINYPESYIKAKNLAMSNPTWDNWNHFEAEHTTLRFNVFRLLKWSDFRLHIIQDLAATYDAVARHMVTHLPPEDIHNSLTLMLAECKLTSHKNTESARNLSPDTVSPT